MASSSRPQAGLRADAVSLDVSLYRGEPRAFLIALRRAFHEFPLVAEMRHSSWLHEEALGTLIDYHIGFANIDQAAYTKAMPPASVLTSAHRLRAAAWTQSAGLAARVRPRQRGALAAHDYLYSRQELQEWKPRIEQDPGARRHDVRLRQQ